MKPDFYIVVEYCEEFEQALALRQDKGQPSRGLLDWGAPVALFPSRIEAKAAIERTEHYRLAFDQETMWPEKKYCKVVPAIKV